MVTGTANFQNTIKGAGLIRFKRLADGQVICVPTPKNLTLEMGIEEIVQDGMNPLAEMVTMGSYVSAQKANLSVTFGHKQVDILQMLFGTLFQSQATTSDVLREVTVPPTGIVPAIAVATGAGAIQTAGSAVVTDEPQSFAAVKGPFGASTPLTRVAYVAGTLPSAGSWSIGAGMALQFPLALAGQVVVIATQETISTGLVLGEVPTGPYAIRATMVMSADNTRVELAADNAVPVLAGTSFTPMGAEQPIKFRFDQSPGSCSTFRMQYTGTQVAC
jgi:hypothetical protein